MASPTTAIRARLASVGGITALVTTNRIYPGVVPEADNNYPRIVFSVDDEEPQNTYRPSSGPVKVRFSVDVHAVSPSQRETLYRLVKTALDNVRGTWDGLRVQGCDWVSDDQQELTDPSTNQTIYLAGSVYEAWMNLP